MSEQINQVIKKNSKIFLGREEDFEEFLLKHFEKIFSEHPLKNLDRFDASERIKTAGFHKDLSAWRNVYKNIVVSSCLEVTGKQKRYDYKFYFIEEKLDANTIAIIEEALEEIGKLKRNFQFKEAHEKVDELLNLIKDRDDRVFNLKLYDEKRDIFKAEKEFKRNTDRLVELEKDIKQSQEDKDLNAIIDNAEEIVQVSKALRKGPLARKYTKILEESQNELKINRDLARLEQYIAQNRERKNYIAVVIDCWKIIKLATDSKKDDLANKYTQVLKEVDEEIAEIKNNIEKTIEDCTKLIENSEFEEALSKINSKLELLDIVQFKGYEDYEERLLAKRTECINAQEAELKLEDDITELDIKLKQKIKENKIFSAKKYCERIIELCESTNKLELVDDYTQILTQLNGKIEDFKGDIDDTIEESIELCKNFYFEEAISNINSVLKIIGQHLPEDEKKLEDVKSKIIKAEFEYRNLEQETSELNAVLGEYLVKQNYVAALEICNQLLSFYEQHKNQKSAENTKFILNQITSKLEEVKEKIETLIQESYQLSEEYLFKEALSKIGKGRELLGKQDLPEYKRKLLKREDQILEEQEAFIKFVQDVPKLETELNEALRDKKYILALNKCDLLIYIYESLNQPDVIKKYNDIYDEINEEIKKVKELVDTVIITSDKLSANNEFETALVSIDEMLEKMREQYYPEFTRTLEFKRQDVVNAEARYKEFLKKIEELDKEMEKSLKKEYYVDALNTCEEIIHISELNKHQEYVEEYKDKLEEIKTQFREKSKAKTSWTKGITKVKASLAKGATKAKTSVAKSATKVKESVAKGVTKIEKKIKKEEIPEKAVITERKAPLTKAKSRTSCLRTSASYYPYIRWTPIRRMMKDAGAEIVACKAVIELIEWLGESAERITKMALNFTDHANRKKITKDSILLAIKYLIKK